MLATQSQQNLFNGILRRADTEFSKPRNRTNTLADKIVVIDGSDSEKAVLIERLMGILDNYEHPQLKTFVKCLATTVLSDPNCSIIISDKLMVPSAHNKVGNYFRVEQIEQQSYMLIKKGTAENVAANLMEMGMRYYLQKKFDHNGLPYRDDIVKHKQYTAVIALTVRDIYNKFSVASPVLSGGPNITIDEFGSYNQRLNRFWMTAGCISPVSSFMVGGMRSVVNFGAFILGSGIFTCGFISFFGLQSVSWYIASSVLFSTAIYLTKYNPGFYTVPDFVGTCLFTGKVSSIFTGIYASFGATVGAPLAAAFFATTALILPHLTKSNIVENFYNEVLNYYRDKALVQKLGFREGMAMSNIIDVCADVYDGTYADADLSEKREFIPRYFRILGLGVSERSVDCLKPLNGFVDQYLMSEFKEQARER